MVTVGEVLKNKREYLKISIDTASDETKIQKRFLEYIEKDEFSPFQSEVFLIGFIKIYAKYLNLDTNKVLALYRRTNPKRKEVQTSILKLPQTKKINLTPKSIITAILILFAILVVGFLLFQIYKFQTPPKLEITYPNNEETVTEKEILIRGKTEKGVTIEINGIIVEVDEEGNFSKEQALTIGTNLVTIKARKNNNDVQESLETRKVIYKEEENNEEEEVEKEKIIMLEIFDSPAWIRLDIDDVNQLTQVVDPIKKEYEFQNKVYIKTGRLSSTKLYFNEEEVSWPESSTKGIAEMTCTLSGEELDCK